jgi:hypothetical protein
MDTFKISIVWFVFGAVIGGALLMQPIVAPYVPKTEHEQSRYVLKAAMKAIGVKYRSLVYDEDSDAFVIEGANLKTYKGNSANKASAAVVRIENLNAAPLWRAVFGGGDGIGDAFLAIGRIDVSGFEFDGDAGAMSFDSAAFLNVRSKRSDRRDSQAPKDELITLAQVIDGFRSDVATIENLFVKTGEGQKIAASMSMVELRGAAWLYDSDGHLGTEIERVDVLAPVLRIANFTALESDQLTLEQYQQSGFSPRAFDFAMTNGRFATNQVEQDNARRYLEFLGEDEFQMEARGSYRFDQLSEIAALESVQLNFDQVADVLFSITLGGLSADPAFDEAFLRRLAESKLVYSQLKVTDHSLVDRYMKHEAGRTGADIAAVRRRTLKDLEASQDLYAKAPIAVEALTALIDFVKVPSALTITVSPDVPMPLEFLALTAMVSPDELAQSLGVDLVSADDDGAKAN